MKKYAAFLKLELIALFREPVSLFFMIVLPIILTFVFGGAFGTQATSYGPQVLGIDTVVPVNVVFLIATTGLMGIPITVSELKELEVLKRYITYPISYHLYFLALITTFALICMLSTVIFTVLSFVIFGATWFMTVSETVIFIIVYLVMMLIFFGIGFLLALIVKSSRAANMITSGLLLALIFTSGIALPVESLPDYVQCIAKIFPMYHFNKVVPLLWISELSISQVMSSVIYIISVAIGLLLLLKSLKLKWD